MDRKKYMKAFKQCMFNLIVVDIVFGAATYHIRAWRGFSCGYDIPSFPTVLLHLAVFLVCLLYTSPSPRDS